MRWPTPSSGRSGRRFRPPRAPGADLPEASNPAASEAYLKGRFFWNKRSREGFEIAIRQFHEAIRLDPTYAPAYAGLADTLTLYTNAVYLPRDDGYKQATDAALKALALDETLAEAHASLGFVLHKYNFDWAGADREFLRAIELNPSYATAHHWRALNFELQGRTQEGYAEIQEALALDTEAPAPAARHPPRPYRSQTAMALAPSAAGRWRRARRL